MNKRYFYIFMFLGLVIRIAFSLFSFHLGDLASWKYIGDSVYIYKMSPFLWWSQGPFNAIPLLGFQFLNYLGFTNSFIQSLFYHIPFIVGDILLIYVVYLITKKYFYDNRYLYTLIIWYNSLFVYISSIKGQTEQWMVLFTVLAFYLLAKKKYSIGFLTLGCAIAFKYLPIIIFPFLYFAIKEKKKFFKGAFLVIVPTIAGFLLMHLINVIFYGDSLFFTYFLDRTGTIFGHFVPNFSEQRFVGTGSSIWGQLYQQGLVTKEILTPIKNKWLFVYAIVYSFVFLLCFLKRKLISKKTETSIGRFVFINLAYVTILFPFLWLYPQTVEHRFLNFIIPMIFIFYFYSLDIGIINLFSGLLIFGNMVYAQKSLFFLISQNLNLFVYTAVVVSLIVLPFVFSVKKKKDLTLFLLFLFVAGIIFWTGNEFFHSLTLMTGYIIPLFVVAFIFFNYLTNDTHENTN